MQAKKTALEYRVDCRLKEVDVGQGGTGAPVVFDSHE
jgi:hypothetical protein